MSNSTSDLFSNTIPTSQILPSLNNARFITPSEVNSTPSTRKNNHTRSLKRIQCDDEWDSDDQQYKFVLTKSCKKREEQEEEEEQWTTPAAKKKKQTQSVCRDRTADIKNKRGQKMQQMCPICLQKLAQSRGSLPCRHQFCFECISEWCKTSSLCPCCRTQIACIYKTLHSSVCMTKMEKIEVQKRQLVFESEYDLYTCYECGMGDNEHVLLICDRCDLNGCHIYCDEDLDNEVPQGNWYCIYCRDSRERRRMRRERERVRGRRNHRRRGQAANNMLRVPQEEGRVYNSENEEEDQVRENYQEEEQEYSSAEQTEPQSIDKGIASRTRSRQRGLRSLPRRPPAPLRQLQLVRRNRRGR